MEIEIKSRTIEFAAKILEDIFSEDAPNLAVEISAHKEKGVTLSAGYAGCCVTLPLATARVIEPGFDEDLDDDYAPHVKITREKDSVELKSVVAPGNYIRTGDFTAHFNVGLTEHPPFSVVVNAKYLLDALGEHTGSVIIRARKNESDAGYGVLQLDFADDADIHEVIMPIREI